MFWHSSAIACTATYMVLTLAVDRVVAINFAVWHRSVRFSRVTKMLCFAMTSASFAQSTSLLFTTGLGPNCSVCTTVKHADLIAIQGALVYVLVPAATLITSNVVFVRALKRRRAHFRPNENSSSPKTRLAAQRRAKRAENERNYIRMLMWASCSYLTLMVLSIFLYNFGISLSKSPLYFETGQLVVALGQLFLVMNNSVNFCFYYSSGPMFREAFHKAFPLFSCHKQNINANASGAETVGSENVVATTAID